MRACSIKKKKNLTGSVFVFRLIKWWEGWVFFQLLPNSFAGKDGVSVPSRWAATITHPSAIWIISNTIFRCFNELLSPSKEYKTKK